MDKLLYSSHYVFIALLLLVSDAAVWSQEKATTTANSPDKSVPPPAATPETKTASPPTPAANPSEKTAPTEKTGKTTDDPKADAAAKTETPVADKKPDDKKSETKPADDKKPANKDDAEAKQPVAEKPPAAPVEKRQTYFELLGREASPNPEAPHIPLWACNPDNQQLIKDGYNYARRLDIIIRIFKDRLKNNKITDLSFADISATYLMNVALGRIVERLKIHREPAAGDLNASFQHFDAVLITVVKAYSALPEFPKAKEKIRQELEKFHKPMLDKEVPRIAKMVEQKQYQAVEELLEKITDRIDYYALWLGNDRPRYLTPFTSIRVKYRVELITEFSKQAAVLWREKQSKVPQTGFDLITRIQVASSALSKGDTTQWEGKEVTGPELLAAVREHWLSVLPQFCRISAYASLIGSSNPNDVTGITLEQGLIGPTKDYGKFYPEVYKALATVIEKDASDCNPEDIPQLYANYLMQVAPMQAMSITPLYALEKPLDALAKKNEEFYENELKKYQSLVAPVLAYRTTWTNSLYSMQSEDIPTVTTLFRTSFMEDRKLGPGFTRANDSSKIFFTYDPVLTGIRRRSNRLLQQPVAVPNAMFDPASPANYLSPLQESCYGVVPVPKKLAGLQKQIEALRNDLLVTENSPPLSLPAAVALWKAEHGYWLHVGADLQNYDAYSAQSMLLKVSADEKYFTHLDQLPVPNGLGQLYFRYQCSEPYWIHHELFFCDLNVE
jgi:hypothetical protein